MGWVALVAEGLTRVGCVGLEAPGDVGLEARPYSYASQEGAVLDLLLMACVMGSNWTCPGHKHAKSANGIY